MEHSWRRCSQEAVYTLLTASPHCPPSNLTRYTVQMCSQLQPAHWPIVPDRALRNRLLAKIKTSPIPIVLQKFSLEGQHGDCSKLLLQGTQDLLSTGHMAEESLCFKKKDRCTERNSSAAFSTKDLNWEASGTTESIYHSKAILTSYMLEFHNYDQCISILQKPKCLLKIYFSPWPLKIQKDSPKNHAN